MSTEELIDKTLEITVGIAKNRIQGLVNIKQVLLEHTGLPLEEQYRNEVNTRRERFQGLPVEEGFKGFPGGKGRKPRVS